MLNQRRPGAAAALKIGLFADEADAAESLPGGKRIFYDYTLPPQISVALGSDSLILFSLDPYAKPSSMAVSEVPSTVCEPQSVSRVRTMRPRASLQPFVEHLPSPEHQFDKCLAVRLDETRRFREMSNVRKRWIAMALQTRCKVIADKFTGIRSRRSRGWGLFYCLGRPRSWSLKM
jgi:hypothetical protein